MASRAELNSQNQPEAESLSRPRRGTERPGGAELVEGGSVPTALELDEDGAASDASDEANVLTPAGSVTGDLFGSRHAQPVVTGGVYVCARENERGQAFCDADGDQAAFDGATPNQTEKSGSGSGPRGGGARGPTLYLSERLAPELGLPTIGTSPLLGYTDSCGATPVACTRSRRSSRRLLIGRVATTVTARRAGDCAEVSAAWGCAANVVSRSRPTRLFARGAPSGGGAERRNANARSTRLVTLRASSSVSRGGLGAYRRRPPACVAARPTESSCIICPGSPTFETGSTSSRFAGRAIAQNTPPRELEAA